MRNSNKTTENSKSLDAVFTDNTNFNSSEIDDIDVSIEEIHYDDGKLSIKGLRLSLSALMILLITLSTLIISVVLYVY